MLKQRKAFKLLLKTYFNEMRGEGNGEFAAGGILDFVSEKIRPTIYNQGIKEDLFARLRSIEK